VDDSGGQRIRLPDGRRLGWAEWGDPSGRPLLYFHGWPGSWAEGRFGDQAAKAHGVRLIAPDRPGMGRSDFQPRRRFLDWPDDVTQVTDALGLERFAVVGVSGGGPYVAVCAWRLPQRLTRVGIASGFGPLDAPGVTAGMSRQNRLLFQVAGWLPVLPRLLLATMAISAIRWPDRVLERGLAAAVDRVYLQRPQLRAVLAQSLVEALRGGGRGAAWELGLYGRPWGFHLEEIGVPVHLWHGEQDGNAPVAMGRYLAGAIPGCRASFFPGEGHLHFVDRLPEILAALCPDQLAGS
jgi:pimeloyl-ACP methyl ester carboxylesterase